MSNHVVSDLMSRLLIFTSLLHLAKFAKIKGSRKGFYSTTGPTPNITFDSTGIMELYDRSVR